MIDQSIPATWRIAASGIGSARAVSARKAWWTPERRVAKSAAMRQYVADSADHHHRVARPDVWTEIEDALLRRLAGTMPLAALVEAINARSRYPRTANAVQCRAYRLGLSLLAPGLTAASATHLFGASPITVQRWIKQGWLSGQRAGTGRTSEWLFSDDDIRRFIRSYPLAYDRTRIRSKHWRGEADVVWRTAGYLTTAEAATYLGISRTELHDRYIRPGLLAVHRGRHPTRFWQLYLRRADLVELRERAG